MKKTLRTTPLTCLAGLVFSISLAHAQAPTYAWAQGLGSTGADVGLRMTTDAAGNTYTTGSFNGTVDFDPGVGTFNLTASGTDIFVCKLDASGAFVWAVSMGGTGSDVGNAITLDATGNVYHTGGFQNTADFDPTASNFDLTSAGGIDIFVCKLNTSGNLVWAVAAGGTVDDQGNTIALDASNNVLTAGNIGNMGTIDFDPGAGATSLTSFGGTDDFIWKLDNAGNFVFVKQIGGTVSDLCNSMVLDASGNIYLTGSFNGNSDFDPDAGTYTLTSLGSNDIFICKLDATGAFVWAVGMGQTGTDLGNYIVLDNTGNVVVTGNFANTVDFNPDSGATSFLTASGLNDPFVCKFTPAGIFVWAKSFTGSGFDRGVGLTINPANEIYAVGQFANTMDFDPSAGGTFNATSLGLTDIYVSALDASGNFLWAITMGGTGDDGGQSVKQAAGKIYVAGRFSTTADFDPTAATVSLTSAGAADIFVAQYQPACIPTDSTITTSACTDYTLNSTTYTTSGTYTQTLTNAGGCDSTITLNLTINMPSSGTHTQTGCNSLIVNGITYTSSGTYSQTVTNAAGCDSVITLNLTINTVDASVTSSAFTITATATPATYQWVFCPSLAPISGETNQTYTAAVDGNYAVIVTQSGCTDTSTCVNITGTGFTAIETQEILQVSPNPSTGKVNLVVNETGKFIINTLDGKTIFVHYVMPGEYTFNLDHLPAGVYVLQLEDNTYRQVKWVKL